MKKLKDKVTQRFIDSGNYEFLTNVIISDCEDFIDFKIINLYDKIIVTNEAYDENDNILPGYNAIYVKKYK